MKSPKLIQVVRTPPFQNTYVYEMLDISRWYRLRLISRLREAGRSYRFTVKPDCVMWDDTCVLFDEAHKRVQVTGDVIWVLRCWANHAYRLTDARAGVVVAAASRLQDLRPFMKEYLAECIEEWDPVLHDKGRVVYGWCP